MKPELIKLKKATTDCHVPSGRPDRSWLFSRLTTGCHAFSCQSFFFSIATALLSAFFLDLLQGCSSTWRCAYEHFSPTLQPLLVLWTSILEGATFYRMNWCKFWPSQHSSTGTSSSGTSGSRRISFTLLHARIRRRIRLSRFRHVFWHRDGNYNCFLWTTVRWIPIANSLQEFFVHAVLSSWFLTTAFLS